MSTTIFRIFLIIALSWNALALKEGKNRVMDEADKILVRSITSQYAKKFKANIESFNNKRSNIPAILSSLKGQDRKKFQELITKGNIKIFPKINYKDGVARIKVGEHRISFTASTLFDRYFYINGKKVPVTKGSVAKQTEQIRSILNTKTTSILHIFIQTAFAVDPFEYSLIATTILLSDEFEESSWCMFCEDEDREAGKANFSAIMKDIENRAFYCENGVEDELFSYRLDEIFEFKKATTELQQKLNSFFVDFDSSDDPKNSLSCQKLVEFLYEDEIADKMHPQKIYVDSITAFKTKRRNEAVHKNFIINKCQPFTKLKNCLIDTSYSAREVYNQTRKGTKKKVRNSNSLPKTYPVKTLNR